MRAGSKLEKLNYQLYFLINQLLHNVGIYSKMKTIKNSYTAILLEMRLKYAYTKRKAETEKK